MRAMNKIIIVTRKTALQELKRKYNTIEQAKFYIEHIGADFSDYLTEDKNYEQALEAVKKAAEKNGRVQVVDRGFVPNMIFGKDDIVIAVGQDGLVANVMKYLDTQPLIGVNPDPHRFDGVLLPFAPKDMSKLLPDVIRGARKCREITMALAETRDGQRLYGVNDIFVGQKTHISARYELNFNGHRENQSSSGIIFSTGLGSTGWYKSIIAEAERIAALYGKTEIKYKPIDWAADMLMYTVREPYPSRFTSAQTVHGILRAGDEFKITSRMPENGVVFSDGVEEDNIAFNAGTELTVSVADKKGRLVI